ncbi:hypothetical protein ACQP00_27540 [Dactylosporangium sp. CS-047395]|uniref:hypothetical protein n=1 Tax=Dactylosporangium sp. CS-047395 TaxID=3239936 RepID=UPI003D904371
MGSRRAVLIGFAVCAVLTTAACAKPKTPVAQPAGAPTAATATTAAPPPADARTELLAATAKTAGTTSAYTAETTSVSASLDNKVTGKIDAARNASTAAMDGFEMVRIGTDLYLKSATPIAGLAAGTWIHVDGAKSGPLTKLGINGDDPANLSALTAGLVSAEKTGPGNFKGVLDMTKTDAGRATMQQLGDAAKQIAFQATVGDGYLVTLLITVPQAIQSPAYDTTLRFTDFGKPVTITAPPGAQPAPPALLEALK